MFELADYLVGIYKVDDCTHSLTIQNADKQRVLGIGDKEADQSLDGEKENLSDSLNISLPNNQVASPNNQVASPSLSQESGIVDGPALVSTSPDSQP